MVDDVGDITIIQHELDHKVFKIRLPESAKKDYTGMLFVFAPGMAVMTTLCAIFVEFLSASNTAVIHLYLDIYNDTTKRSEGVNQTLSSCNMYYLCLASEKLCKKLCTL